MSDSQEFEQTVATIECMLQGDDIYETFRENEVDVFSKAFKAMREDIRKAMESDTKIEASGDPRLVVDTLHVILRAFLTRQVSESIRDFMGKYILLAFNWNKIADSGEIAENVQAVQNLMNYQCSVIETIKVLQLLIREARGILEFKPPVFDLSNHYLRAIMSK